jgi:metal-responsive CopG/Arc/MetJ family transcriptional regulator
MTEKTSEQVSVKLPVDLMAAVDRAAQAEHRTRSQQIRHYVASAVESQRQHQAA